MKKLVLSFAASLLWISLFALSANATDLKIIIDNETDRPVLFKKSVTNYSYFPGYMGTGLICLDPKEKEEFDLSIYSRSYFEIFDKENEESFDKINFQIIGENEDQKVDNYIFWTLKQNMKFEPEIKLPEFKLEASSYMVSINHQPSSLIYTFLIQNK